MLAARIQKEEVPHMFAARDVYRMGWSGLDREQTTSAIDVLLSLRWLEERTEATTGRDRTRYATNPRHLGPKCIRLGHCFGWRIYGGCGRLVTQSRAACRRDVGCVGQQ